VVITGKNGAGKSSGTYVVYATLEGMSKRKVPWQERPVRVAKDGQPQPLQAETKLVLESPDGGEVVITRTFKQKDGKKVTSKVEISPVSITGSDTPQKWLSRLLSTNSMNPVEFANADPGEQVAILCRSIGIEDQRQELVNKVADLKQKRRDVNRDAKKASGELDRMGLPAKPATADIDVDEESATLRERSDQYAELKNSLDGVKDHLVATKQGVVIADARVKSLTQQLDEANEQLRQAEKQHESASDEAATTVVEAVSSANYNADEWCEGEGYTQILSGAEEVVADLESVIAECRGNIDAANANMAAKAEYDRYQTTSSDIAKKQAESDNLSKEIHDTNQQVLDLLGSYELPIEGLELTPDGLTKDGVPLSQQCTSDMLVLSVALEIGVMDQDDERLRVIVLRGGDSFEPEPLDKLFAMAEERDVQLIVEQVTHDRELATLLKSGTDEQVVEWLAENQVMTAAMKDGRSIQ